MLLYYWTELQNFGATFRQAVEDVIEFYQMKLISPHISARFKLQDVNDAFDFIRERRSTGKVVLEIRWMIWFV